MAEPPTDTPFDDDKNTRLHFAAASGSCDQTREELQSGQRVDAENYMGWTPLMMAARNGHSDVVELLLENRADATKTNRYGMSIFLIAIAGGNLEIVRKFLTHLLSGGVSKQSMDKYFSPLSVSVLFNNEDIFKFLLEKGFNINAVTIKTKFSPLMYAYLGKNESFRKMLHANYANVSLLNVNGCTAMDLVRQPKIVLPPCQPLCPNLTAPPPPPVQYINQEIHPNNQEQPIMQPMIIISQNSPYFQPTPMQQYSLMRKSSDVLTPAYILTPNISPVCSQMFFPPEFSPSHYPLPATPQYIGFPPDHMTPNLFVPQYAALHSYDNLYYPANYNCGRWLAPISTPVNGPNTC